MTTELQIIANRQNSISSTGAKSAKGKSIVSKNAIKHGIFAKDIIVNTGNLIEDQKEFNKLTQNVIADLKPQGQIQLLIAEKIAVDFWRLKRVFRFETGSIISNTISLFDQHYNAKGSISAKPRKSNAKIDSDISSLADQISYNSEYIGYLKQGLVNIDQPIFNHNDFTADIHNDLSLIVFDMCENSQRTKANVKSDSISFDEVRDMLFSFGYDDDKIIESIISLYQSENEKIAHKIGQLETQKRENDFKDQLNIKLGSLPLALNCDKIIKYEQSIQKSIFHNMALLKQLQSQ